MQLRTYLLIDQMQPQYGALTGKTMQGEIPVEGMAEDLHRDSAGIRHLQGYGYCTKDNRCAGRGTGSGTRIWVIGNPLAPPGVSAGGWSAGAGSAGADRERSDEAGDFIFVADLECGRISGAADQPHIIRRTVAGRPNTCAYWKCCRRRTSCWRRMKQKRQRTSRW